MAENLALAELHGSTPSDLGLTLWDVFHTTATKYPGRDALICPIHVPNFSEAGHSAEAAFTETTWSYHDLRVRVEAAAHSLRHLQCGGPRHHLVILTRNIGEWAYFFWVAAKLEMAFVPLDPAEDDNVSEAFSLLNPQIVVAQDNVEAKRVDSWAKKAPPRHLVKILIIEQYAPDWLSLSHLCNKEYATSLCRRQPLQAWDAATAESIAMIIFTSGTTGTPKACPHTHNNLISQTHDYDPNMDRSLVDRWLVHTPVHHIFAINNALRAWRYGGCVVIPSASFRVQESLRALIKHRCTVMSATPTLVKALLSSSGFPESGKLDLSVVTLAGTSIGRDDVRLCREKLGSRDAIQAYGMSESGPVISWSRQDPLLVDGYHSGIGKVLPGVSIRICNPQTRKILQRGEIGELHIGGRSVISAYLAQKDSESFYQEDGRHWLATGDQAKVDNDGVVYILGRYKDLIIRGGENIHPAAIEEAMQKLLNVQVQVVGLPDSFAGEVPVAIVKLPDGVSKQEVRGAAKRLGPKYALHSIYEISELGLSELPVTSLKKPKRQLLKKRLLELHKDADDKLQSDSPSEHKTLVNSLAAIWENICGVLPDAHTSVHDFADSIMLLQYCDAVLRQCHRQLYLQDLFISDTVYKQATVLIERGKISQSLPEKTLNSTNPKSAAPLMGGSTTSIRGYDTDLTEAADAQAQTLCLETPSLENCIPLRADQHRMVVGQRPDSYHTRMGFLLRGANGANAREALTRIVQKSPLLRSTLLQTKSGRLFHAVYDDPRLFSLMLEEMELATEAATRKLLDEASSTLKCPHMFSGTIIHCIESKKCYLALTFNHSIADAMSLWQFQRDLDDALHDKEAIIPQHTPYTLWADLFQQNQSNVPAQKSVEFHVQRLRGISRFKDALWPKQRAPGWMISSDLTSAAAHDRQVVREKIWNDQWAARSHGFRFPRRARVVRLPSLQAMQAKHNVTPELLTRCALILFNLVETGSKYAVFNSWQSGRSWPFVPQWMHAVLPPAMSIDGPTAQWRLNVYAARGAETVLCFLRRLQKDETIAANYDHAPWDKVKEALGEEGPIAEDASFRQAFVWDVTLGVATRHGHQNNYRVLEPVGRCDWADCGMFWNAFMLDRENLYFIASWDTAQMNAEEVDGCCDRLAQVIRELGSERNWGKTLSEVFPNSLF